MHSSSTLAAPSLRRRVLKHLLAVVQRTPAHDEPFSHFYLENVFPDDVYADLLDFLPADELFQPISPNKHARDDGVITRNVLPLTVAERIAPMADEQREFWQEISAALSAPELKELVFGKLATDLSRRFGTSRDEVRSIPSFAKPAMMRDLEGYEIPPHPDGRAKIVTMQLYLPRDRSQAELGTSLYKRRLTPSGLLSWHGRFQKIKQFAFLPNSGYAFAVSNSLGKRSWHGREQLPPNCGVRNSLMNLFFASEERNY